jgi:hypothetical protein
MKAWDFLASSVAITFLVEVLLQRSAKENNSEDPYVLVFIFHAVNYVITYNLS